jgi:hypothetical protein
MKEIKIILLLMIMIERMKNMKTFKASNMWKKFLCGALSTLLIFGGGRWSPTVVDAANAINLDVYNVKDGYVHITSTDYTGY